MNKKQKHLLWRIVIAFVIFAVAYGISESGLLEARLGQRNAVYAEFALFLVPYLIAGWDVIANAFRNIAHGHALDEDFLMTIATFGAFALVFFPESEPHMAEGAAVMLFFQIGELFQSYAVDKSRKSIADMMDIAPEFANVMRDGQLVQIDPSEVSPGEEFVVLPGERIPLDGVVVQGESRLDTTSLTGESVPRSVRTDDEVVSGCVNMTGKLVVRATKPFEDSTVNRILELVENASEKKARTENFITRFARIYTPVVVGIAVALALLPPLVLGGGWSDWILRGLIFLVVSCPCALVISVPLSFFGGIGAASRAGILVKGSNYLEALAHVDTIAFDKTGTLTDGTFSIVAVLPADDTSEEKLVDIAAHAEAYSTHPIAQSIREYYGKTLEHSRVSQVEETGGQGIRACIDEKAVFVGNDALMAAEDVVFPCITHTGTLLHVAAEGTYLGSIVIADREKPDAARAIEALYQAGVKRTVMLTGDKTEVAESVASDLDITEVHAELLPQDKVSEVEALLEQTTHRTDDKGKLAFVGDGINDAPVLMRADVGIAMGAMGSDAAIEAADIVLMDDKPISIALAIRIARKTMRIVWQNIVFALGVKFAVLVLAAVGIANMWMAVFADVGVCVLAILNAMRAMRVTK